MSTILDESAKLTAAAIRAQYQPEHTYAVIEMLMPFISRKSQDLSAKSFGLAPCEELESCGVLKCHACILNFDARSGPFLQYAMRSISGDMLHYLRDHTLTHIPGTSKETMYAVNRFIISFRRKHSVTPTIEQICSGACLSYARVEEALKLCQYVKVSAQIADHEDASPVGLDGLQPEDEDLTGSEAKEIVAEAVALRRQGYGQTDFEVFFGMDAQVAEDLVNAIDLYYTGPAPASNDLYDWLAGVM